nr:heterogeneous nuclear ribonucleoproteins A2/B1 isoform X2 [Aegilops tauschii subsp. strangulata]
MAGYPEDNQHAMNGYEDEVEEVEEVDEEGRPGRRGRRDGGDGGGYGDAGGDDGRAGGGDSSGKIFVGGVAWETTEESFSKHFGKYGAITDSVIMKDKHTKMPRGFGFVTFSDPSVIDKVLEDEHNIDGRTVEVKRTVPREEMSSKDGPKTRKIFVGGLPSTLTEDDLRDHFSSYGNVVEHQIMVDHSTGRSRGFGFVTFESEDSVERVISEGRMRDLGGKQVEIKKAEPKKHGGDHSSNGRSSHSGGGGYRSSYRSSGGGGGGGYGYGAGHRSAAAGSYYDSTGYGYGRGGYGAAAAAAAYGGNAGYGSGFGGGYGGSMYGGAYGAYGAYGGGAYGAGAYGGGAYGAGAYGGGAYGAGGYGAGGYGSYGGAGAGAGGAGGGGGGSAGGRGSSRYHPYGK